MPRILIVEDSSENRQLVSWILEDAGYEFAEAETAEEGLAILQKEAIDGVLMDIGLPGISGDEAIKKVREELRLTSLPVIALTGHATEADHNRFMASGATKILTKPIDEDLLIQTLASVIK